MRKLTSLTVVALLAVPMAACDEQPTQLEETAPELQQLEGPTAASHSQSPNAFSSTTWANDHLWEWTRNQPVFNQGQGNDKFVFITPSADIAQRPFYVIGWKAGNDGEQSTAFFGPHDHVTTARSESQGSFKATVQLFVVIAAEDAGDDVASTEATNFFTGNPVDLAYAADVDDDGVLEHFTNVETVQAAHQQGLVKVMTTFEETVLTMRDIEG